MKKQSLLYGIGGLLIGAIVSGAAVYSVQNNTNESDRSMTMQEMSSMLKDKTGDEFDKAFISGMIEHHQGAIDMANVAKKNAKHDEIKNMADDIIAAQSEEIHTMQSWQTDWSYKDTSATHNMNMMNH
jgi:uncharacterized protein (DUF305 family)